MSRRATGSVIICPVCGQRRRATGSHVTRYQHATTHALQSYMLGYRDADRIEGFGVPILICAGVPVCWFHESAEKRLEQLRKKLRKIKAAGDAAHPAELEAAIAGHELAIDRMHWPACPF